ncbi:MAG: hypothetical protein HY718_17070 [Planctomycetes bacterium]|nr:hypothetical protein [Planctomycetota bacterium]
MVVVATTVGTHGAAGLLLSAALEPVGFNRRVADALNAELRPGERIAVCGYKEPTLYFYTREPIETVDPYAVGDFLNASRGGPPILLAADERGLEIMDRTVSDRLRPHFFREVIGYNHVKQIRWQREDGELNIPRNESISPDSEGLPTKPDNSDEKRRPIRRPRTASEPWRLPTAELSRRRARRQGWYPPLGTIGTYAIPRRRRAS